MATLNKVGAIGAFVQQEGVNSPSTARLVPILRGPYARIDLSSISKVHK